MIYHRKLFSISEDTIFEEIYSILKPSLKEQRANLNAIQSIKPVPVVVESEKTDDECKMGFELNTIE